MKKEWVIVVAIAVIIVSAAVAITVANMADAQGNVLRYERDGITYFYDIIAPSTITVSSLEVNETEISYDDGGIDLIGCFIGVDDPGHAVLFSPNKTCTLDKVKIYGKYVNLSDIPVYSTDRNRVFALEIWDNDSNLIYKLTDYSQAYFNTTYKWTEIDIPDINITNDFYVCVFERASIYIGADKDNPAMRSFEVHRCPNRMINTPYPEPPDTKKPLNWMIRAVIRNRSMEG
jgi:hypothetical protein